MECIYAFPPDYDEEELRRLEQYAHQVGLGGGSDDENGGDSVGIGSEYGLLQEYEESLESKYGIVIDWGRRSYDTNRLQQLRNLDSAIAYIVNYLAQKDLYGSERAALEAFKEHFGQSNVHGQLTIYLGADAYIAEVFPDVPEKDLGYYGFVPLPQSTEYNLDKMFLGSKVSIPTIVHEFGHVIDRNIRVTRNLLGKLSDGEYRLRKGHSKYGVNLNKQILELVIEGFAAKQLDPSELWADVFMTAVLDPSVTLSDEPYKVFSVKAEYLSDFTGTELFDCGCENGICKYCDDRDVMWRRNSNKTDFTQNAKAVMSFLPGVLWALFALERGGDTSE